MPAVNVELCVCVSRARSMTEQQEHGEVTGLLSSHDLEPSKDDDTHGHFRQITHAQHAICILCTVMGRSLGEIYFHSSYFVLYLMSHNGPTCTQRGSKLRLTKNVFVSPSEALRGGLL